MEIKFKITFDNYGGSFPWSLWEFQPCPGFLGWWRRGQWCRVHAGATREEAEAKLRDIVAGREKFQTAYYKADGRPDLAW